MELHLVETGFSDAAACEWTFSLWVGLASRSCAENLAQSLSFELVEASAVTKSKRRRHLGMESEAKAVAMTSFWRSNADRDWV